MTGIKEQEALKTGIKKIDPVVAIVLSYFSSTHFSSNSAFVEIISSLCLSSTSISRVRVSGSLMLVPSSNVMCPFLRSEASFQNNRNLFEAFFFFQAIEIFFFRHDSVILLLVRYSGRI